MSEEVITVKKLSKYYQLGAFGGKTLGEDLKRWWAKIRGKPDPLLKVHQQISENEEPFIWALRDISFSVKEGEVLGIIGKNGAGKSTLLKVLSQITSPSEGSIRLKGRVASLLEVGTGFHPELTGKENVYLNGAILGMTKAEVRNKFDEIIAFAGVEKFVDTPVKRYSSGMRVRLGFAVAAFLEPEILIVDEVLAVGDAEFQKRAIGKMKDVSKGDGRTVLFVSHNMKSVEMLCDRAMVIEKGMKVFEGDQKQAVRFYLKNKMQQLDQSKDWKEQEAPGNSFVKLLGVSISPDIENEDNLIYTDNDIRVNVKFKMLKSSVNRLDVGIFVKDEDENNLFNISTAVGEFFSKGYEEGEFEATFLIKNCLAEGIYNLSLRVNENQSSRALCRFDEVLSFKINLKKGEVVKKQKWLVNPEYKVSHFQKIK